MATDERGDPVKEMDSDDPAASESSGCHSPHVIVAQNVLAGASPPL